MPLGRSYGRFGGAVATLLLATLAVALAATCALPSPEGVLPSPERTASPPAVSLSLAVTAEPSPRPTATPPVGTVIATVPAEMRIAPTVTPPTLTPPPAFSPAVDMEGRVIRNIFIDRTSGPVGSPVTVVGVGGTLRPLDIVFYPRGGPGGVLLHRGLVSDDGTFRVTVTIPEAVGARQGEGAGPVLPGPYTIRVRGFDDIGIHDIPFTVTEKP